MLTTEQIDAEAFARWGEMKGAPLAMCRGFARAIEAEARRDALEEAAKEFDKRAVLLDGGPSVGWYEPNEPAEIIRKLKEDTQ